MDNPPQMQQAVLPVRQQKGKGQKRAAKGKPSGAANFKRAAKKRRNINARSKK